ncbi:TonB-linked SusC/RagA family outer membrane protein [Mucilaginibacter yixingensis]|uniref:TonB-linked SusC/RagA family outer membrane protein n=1 Tax=Mucilaginibacter yixingensis TaxID=1295612 RepID=A0A2T5J982_9SPHI|nr:TonB-dependent receptor [Mucilaginibacter yixingensis]PTQ96569.1 TonB-linked SusC/RagA family outer membrane protein [Mucilaginibacter yixingensis]
MDIFIRSRQLLFYHFLLSALVLVPLFAEAQKEPPPTINSKLEGQVLDASNNQPLPGAVVAIQGTTHSVSTNIEGRFNFVTGQKYPYTLVITFIGYEKQEKIANGSPVTIYLKPETKQLNDVVVVGYGTQTRKSLISSVSSIKTDEVRDKPQATFAQQLQGKASGLQVSASTGIPGDGMFIRIRGTTSINASNDPLYVIDGVYVNSTSLQHITTQGQASSPLSDINPDDIESISVLKDADATAIYGARAANGVIVITTKRGKKNSSPKVNLSTYFGGAWAPKLWDLVTGPQHAELVNEFYRNSEADAIAAGNATAAATYKYQPFRALTDNPTATPAPRGLPQDQPTYDRLHEAFRTGFLQNYNASISGGNGGTTYYIGGGLNKQQADLKTDDYRRASFKVNIDQQIGSFLTVGTSNTLTQTYRTLARVGDGPQGGILQSALHTPTYLPEYNADGSPAKWAGFDNLQVLLNNTNMHSTSNRIISNVYGEAKLGKDFKFRTSWSIDFNNYNEFQYWNSLTNLGAANKNLGTSGVTNNTIWTDEQTLNYNHVFGKSTVGALVGNSLQGTVNTYTQAQGTSFPNDSFQQIQSAAVTTATGSETRSNLSSFFGRVNYNYASKYYIEASARYDGSSRFGANHQFGFFPSAGIAWRAKEEDFLKNVEAINDLKFRASIGVTGNQNGINDFASRGLWGAGANYLSSPGITAQQLANPDLKWESTRQSNIGIDLSLFNDRLTLSGDVYDKYTSNLLLNLPLSSSSGFTSILANAGEISNRGFEFSISSTNIKKDHFSWSTDFNFSRNVNKIEKLPTPVVAAYAAERMVQGQSMYTFYAYKQLYVDPQTGNAVYDDYDHDGKITSNDLEPVGNALPKFTAGLTNSFRYRAFDLSVFFNIVYGNKVYNNNDYFLEGGGTRDANRAMDTRQLERWQKPGDITDMPRLTALNNNYTLSPTTRNIEDGSFLRLDNATLGYTIPKSLTQRIGIASVRVYVTGTNLWLWTKYRGPDPEINVSSSQTVLGYDLGTPPLPRTIQAGANISF